MSETAETIEQKTETPSLFNPELWKPTPTEQASVAPVIEEKKEEVIVEAEKPALTEEKGIEEKKPEIQAVPEKEKINFANEESEKVFNLLKEGKIDDVYSIISEQKKLANIEKETPADIIKLNLQYKNKDFTPQEIQELFEDTYIMPEKPEQGTLETDDEFKIREDKYKAQTERIENKIKRDAKPAAAELLKLSKEIVLPEIQKQVPVNKEPTQEELDAQKLQVQQFLKIVDEATNALNGYQVTFKDEEVSIPVTYKLTKEEKAAIQPLILLSEKNAGEFFEKIGWISEGKVNAVKMAEDLPFILNKESVLQKMVTETGNKRHEASIKAIKNIDYTGGKQPAGDVGLSTAQMEKNWVTGFFSK